MIGVSLEKLVVVLVVAALILGPSRLPASAERIGAWARGLRAFVDAARARAEQDLGVPVRTEEWRREVRRYDPRRIVREALAEPAATSASRPHRMPDEGAVVGAPVDASTVDAIAPASDAPIATRTRWVVDGGSSGHPRRIRVVEPLVPSHALEERTDGTPDAAR